VRRLLALTIAGLVLASHACASEPIERGNPQIPPEGPEGPRGGSAGSPEGPGGGPADSPATCEPVPTCEAMCAHIYQPRACTTADGLSPCIAYCENEYEAWMPDACLEVWHEFLGCRSCVEVSCDEVPCSGPVCEGDPPYFLGCDDLDARVHDCAGPCLRGGTAAGSSSDLSYRVEGTHCECPDDLAAGGPAGESCVTDSDCAEECCHCADNDGAYRARACDHGTCLGGNGLCAMKASAVFVDTFCNGDGT